MRAAATGLTPLDVYAMTSRELEIWFEGWSERRRQEMELLAWVQANLINIHIPKGKAGVKMHQLLPKWAKRLAKGEASDEVDDVPGEGGDPVAAMAKAKDRVRQKRDEGWWQSGPGVALRRALGEDVGGADEDEEGEP